MSRVYRLILADMRTSCQKILRYTRGLTFEEFVSDERTLEAVVLNLILLGEAAQQIPQDVRDRHLEVEWRRIAGLRDVVVHHYFGWDEEILWDVIRNHVPRLLSQLEHLEHDS